MSSLIPTPEQARIVESPLVPLRIAAGAGTGKTTTLALRIAGVLRRGEGTVLGLTFTNKAAAELAERVAGVIDDHRSPSVDIEIATYHGFAHTLLHEFGAFVGVERGAGLITPTFSRQLVSDAMAITPVEVLNITWDQTIDQAAQLAARLSENLEPPSALESARSGDEHIDAERSDYARVIARYVDEKARLGVVDYGDLIARAHELVARHPDVAARVRARYTAVFLDEYQDTNPAQRMLLQALFGGGFPVTAVGDVDQTIYEWRGATPANFDRFPEHFPDDGRPAPSLDLTLNRRSGHRILSFANAIRQQAGADPAGALRPTEDAPPGVVACRWFGTAVDEAGFIADEILRLHDEGVPWKEMAVLFRKNRSIELIRRTLEEADIPVEVANVGGLIDIPEIADVYAWLRILADPADHAALLRVWLGSRFRLGLGDVRPLAQWVHDHRGDDEAESLHTLVEAAEHSTVIAEIDERTRAALDEFTTRYRKLLQVAQGASLIDLTRAIIAETGAWPEIEAMPDAARKSARLNLYRFLDLAEDWSPLEGRPSLDAFLRYLRMMAEEDAEELSAASLSGEDAVALLTVHRAKGLEWDAVFVPTVVRDNFPARSQRFDDPFASAAILPYELRIEPQPEPAVSADMAPDDRKDILRQRHLRSEWRLAYVAATRAKRTLWLTGAWWYGHPAPTKRAKQPSPLYELAQSCDSVNDHGQAEPPAEPPRLILPPSDEGAPDPVFGEAGWAGAVRQLFDDPGWARDKAQELAVVPAYDAAMESTQGMLFSLPPPMTPPVADPDLAISVTGLVTFATCPRRYHWTAVEMLPRRPSPAAQRGVEVHRRIELHNRGAIPLDEVSRALYDVPETGEDEDPIQPPFAVFEQSRFAATSPLFVEVPFDIRIGGATVRGRIDAIYPGWEIVDFKSGRPSDGEPLKRQLEAYALAVAQGAFGNPPDRLAATFAYLGGGSLTEITYEISPEWLDTARKNLESAIDEIGAGVNAPAPGQACHSCDFLQFCEEGKQFVGAVRSPSRSRSPR